MEESGTEGRIVDSYIINPGRVHRNAVVQASWLREEGKKETMTREELLSLICDRAAISS